MRLLITLFLVLCALAALPLVVLSVILIAQSSEMSSKLFGGGVIALFFSVVAFIQCLTSDVGSPGKWAIIFLIAGAGLWGGAYQMSPSGLGNPANSAFESLYTNGSAPQRGYLRWNPLNWPAERDQVRVANLVGPMTGVLMTGEQSRKLSPIIRDMYAEMVAEAPDLVAFGSQLPALYQDTVGLGTGGSHAYIYRPETSLNRAKGNPVLILLHDGIGNLQANLWALKPFADRLGVVLLAPTFGAGNWESPAANEVVDAWLKYCEEDASMDAANIILAGVGKGGQGVTLAASALPKRVRGLVYIGAFLDHEVLDTAKFLDGWFRRPVLIVHGATDLRYPVNQVETMVANFKSAQVPAKFVRVADGDDYILYTHQKQICDQLETWVRSW